MTGTETCTPSSLVSSGKALGLNLYPGVFLWDQAEMILPTLLRIVPLFGFLSFPVLLLPLSHQFLLANTNKSLALEFLSWGQLLGNLTQDSLFLMVDRQQHMLAEQEVPWKTPKALAEPMGGSFTTCKWNY